MLSYPLWRACALTTLPHLVRSSKAGNQTSTLRVFRIAVPPDVSGVRKGHCSEGAVADPSREGRSVQCFLYPAAWCCWRAASCSLPARAPVATLRYRQRPRWLHQPPLRLRRALRRRPPRTQSSPVPAHIARRRAQQSRLRGRQQFSRPPHPAPRAARQPDRRCCRQSAPPVRSPPSQPSRLRSGMDCAARYRYRRSSRARRVRRRCGAA